MKLSLLELAVVFIVAFVVIGPEKLPAYTKKGIKLFKDMKGYMSDISQEVNEAVGEPLKETTAPIKELADEITKPLEDVKKTIKDAMK